MPRVLTKGSKVSCDHPLPGATAGGPVTLEAGQSVLQVGTQPVLAKSLANATIGTGCSQTRTNAGEVPCPTVDDQSDGFSSVLQVGDQPVLVMGAKGTTKGKPLNTWSAKDAGQSVLEAD
jgi:hypothetical protein